MSVNEIREAIKALAAGPEMNMLLAHFMGRYPNVRKAWVQHSPGGPIFSDEQEFDEYEPCVIYDGAKYGEELLPNFSGHEGSALLVLHKVRGDKDRLDAVRVFIESLKNGGWSIHLEPRDEIATYTVEEQELALTICRAVLLYAAGRIGFREIYTALLIPPPRVFTGVGPASQNHEPAS